MKKLLGILTSLAIVYLGVLLFVYVFQRSFLYFPPSDYRTPNVYGLVGVESILIPIEGSGDCRVWWHPPTDETQPVIMMFHGNASGHDTSPDIVADFVSRGFGVLSAEYPGYAGCAGRPTQTSILQAVTTQYDWIIAQGITSERIVFYGTSLGTGVAAQLSTRREPALLILDAPFNSALDMGRISMPVFPISFLMKDQFRSDVALRNKDIPLVWTHGTRDKVVPLSQGRKLYDAYNGPKRALIIEGGMHTNGWALGGREIALKTIDEMFDG